MPHTTGLSADLLALASEHLDAFVVDLRTLVSIDSGSGDADGVRRVADWSCARLEQAGFAVERREVTGTDGLPLGPVVVARRPGTGRRVLLFAHMDTVFAPGTASSRPFRLDGHRALGPGVCDDKGGLLAGVHACELLVASGLADGVDLTVALTPDEEIGAPGSAPVLAELARESDVALCLEGARESGDLVASRKGVADVHFRLRGRAAHSGIEPGRGASAAVEAAHLALDVAALDRSAPGLTVNVGVLEAGSRPNVVAEEARIVAEVRATSSDVLDVVVRQLRRRAAEPVNAGVAIELEVRDRTDPMERTTSSDALARLALSTAAELGLDIDAVATGGVSDANIVAATGCPTLDGLGPVGGDDHSESEWLDISSVPTRTALLASLVARLGAGDLETYAAGSPESFSAASGSTHH
ncbi:M20 family metallopeptidase [Terrabacter sp. AAH1]